MSAEVIHARDVRDGETWTTAQRAKNDAIFVIVRICLFFVGFMPRSVLRFAGVMLGRIAHLVLRKERRAAIANLARAFPESDRAEREDIARRAFLALGRDLGDAAHAMTSGRFDRLAISPEDACILHSSIDRGRGVLFVSAHLGPWEQVAASVVAAGFPLTTIARESYDPRLTAIYDTLRERHGVRSIYRGGAGSSVRAVRHLRSGGVLGIVMDLRSRVPSIDVPFLGHDAPTAVGPARLALRTGASVVVASAAPRENGELAVTITSIDTSDLAPGRNGERELTTRLNAEISRRITALPDRWLWMHPRYGM